MNHTGNGTPSKPNPRRRRRSPMQIFVDSYLPPLIIGAVVLLFILFAVGSIQRSNERRAQAQQASIAASESQAQRLQELTAEAQRLIAEAEVLAKSYCYDEAIARIDSFSGNIYNYDELLACRNAYLQAKEALVAWEDPSDVVNLSFQMLMVDPVRAFANKTYGTSFKRNFITVEEFTAILQQLYDNDYILVDIYDLFEITETGTTVTYNAKTLHLPAGKKPLMLTQTQVNFYTYMTDGNGDGLPDKDGSGFASKLVVDAEGNLKCEYVDAQGNTLTGNYDLVPLLEDFITRNPDFSYQGARAVLAVSGYDGLFGYRTDPETATKISKDFYDQQLAQLPAVVKALRDKGYHIACYTYGNVAYGDITATKIRNDLTKWKNEVTPLLGETEILVLAKNSDISNPKDSYSGEKFSILQDAGFHIYLGFCDGSAPWAQTNRTNIRQGRILVTGWDLKNNAKLYKDLFDAASVLDPNR